MLKKIFVSAVLLLAILSFVVSLLKGNNNGEKTVTIPDRVAVINISGTIISGDAQEDDIFHQQQGITSGTIMRQIRDATNDNSVKAVLLKIDSGGGSATAAEEVGRELKRFKENAKKPIVACIGDTGASAAYWIAACSSDKIYANATSLTGSIGVYMPYMNVEELYKKIGVTSNKIKSGPHKDMMSMDREMTDEEKAMLQNIVNEIYEEFVTTIAEGRKMDESKVRTLADGRVYTGAQAKNLGLVDEIGNYYDALVAAGELAKLKPEKNGLPHVKIRQQKTGWGYIFGSEMAKIIKSEIINQFKAETMPSIENNVR
ncbi:MAG: signal peptide peptidase SppA [Phascolarctobacterium sp.]|nr:signal peptide peptidase SppA [Phascolarctobacterium sp.]